MSLSLLSTQRDTVRPLVTRQTTPSSPIANMTREYKRLEERKKKMSREEIYVFQKKESNFENESLIAPTAKLLLKCTGTQTVTNYRLLMYY